MDNQLTFVFVDSTQGWINVHNADSTSNVRGSPTFYMAASVSGSCNTLVTCTL